MGQARLWSCCLFLCALVRAVRVVASERDAVLPPIDVPVEEAAPGDSRDATATLTRVDAQSSGGEIRSTAELVATAPGASVHRLGDVGQLATVALRGSSTDQVLVLLDGIPLTSAAGGTVDLSTIPEGLIDHIDVLRGDAAARYGAGALGGVIDIVTRRPGPGEGEASLSYGSSNTFSAAASDGFSNAALGLSTALTFLRSDGDFSYRFNPTPDLSVAPETRTRENNQSLALGALAAGSMRLSRGRVEAVLQGVFLDRGLAGTVYAPTRSDHAREGRGLLGVDYRAPAALGSARFPIDLDLQASGRLDALDVDLASSGATRQLDLSSGLDATFTLRRAPQALALTLGVADEALSVTGQLGPSRGSAAAALSDRISLFSQRVTLVPSVRADQVGAFNGLSPKLGASVFPWAFLELRGNAGLGFRAPTFGELFLQQGIAQPNPTLQPETNQSLDLGASLRLGPALLSATAFLARYDNLIIYELFPPMAAKPFNEGKSVVQGVELELTAHPLRTVTAAASYTFLDAFDNDPGSSTYGHELPYRPNHRAHGRLAWHQGRVRASVDLDLASGQSLNRAATLSIPGHAVVDAAAGVRVWSRPDLWLGVDVKNLTDSQVPDTFGYPLPGLAFFASIQLLESPQGEHR